MADGIYAKLYTFNRPCNKRKSEFSDLSSDSPYLQAMALKNCNENQFSISISVKLMRKKTIQEPRCPGYFA